MSSLVSFVYEVRARKAFLKNYIPELTTGEDEKEIVYRYEVCAHKEHLRVNVTQPFRLEMVQNLNTRERWIMDHTNKRYAAPQEMRPFHDDPQESQSETSKIYATGLQSNRTIGGRLYTLLEYRADLFGLEMQAWIFDRQFKNRRLSQAFWFNLIPWMDSTALPHNLPAEIIIRQGQSVLQASISELQPNKDASFEFKLPKDYKEGIEPIWLASNEQNAAESETKTQASVQASMTTSQRMEIAERSRRIIENIGSLVPPITADNELLSHFALLDQPSVLNQLQNVLNRLARTQGNWSIALGTLIIDWWRGNMQWYVNPDKPDNPGPRHELLMEMVKGGLFAYRAFSGKELPSGNPDLLHDYQLLINDIDAGSADNNAYRTINGVGQPILDINANIQSCNLSIETYFSEDPIGSLVLNTISPDRPQNQARRQQIIRNTQIYISRYVLLCEARFKNIISDFFNMPPLTGLFPRAITATYEDRIFDDLTDDIRITWPVPPRRFENDMVVLGIDEIEGEITLNHQDVVTDLSFFGNGMNVELTIPQIYFDFYFWSYPAPSWKSVGLGILTGGLSAAELTHAGWGYGNVDNAKIVFRIRPEFNTQNGQAELKMRFRPDRSSVDSSAWLASINQNILGVAGSVLTIIGSILDGFNNKIFSELAKAVQDKVLIHWPSDLWNTNNGPAVVSSDPIDMRVWRGQLAQPNEIPGRDLSPLAINASLVESLGNLYTESYLTQWVRSKLGEEIAEYATLEHSDGRLINEQVWEETFSGLDLPDPAGLPDPELAQTRSQSAFRDQQVFLSGRGEALTAGNPLQPISCQRPASSPTQRFYRTFAYRYLPQVRFVESGELDYAGQLVILYDVRLEAVRVANLQRMVGMSNTHCRQLPSDIFGGIPPFGTPIGPDHPGFILLSNPLREFSFNTSVEQPLQGMTEYERYILDPNLEPVAAGENIDPDRMQYNPVSSDPGFTTSGQRLTQPQAAINFETGDTLTYCENPRCMWQEIRDEKVLKTYLRARIEVKAKVRIGFKLLGSLWPAETDIVLQANTVSASGIGGSLQLEPPLDMIGNQQILQKLEEWCLANARSLLEPLQGVIMPAMSIIPVNDELLILVESILDDIFQPIPPQNRDSFRQVMLNMLRFEQSILPNAFRYRVENEILYWPLRLVEHSADIFRV